MTRSAQGLLVAALGGMGVRLVLTDGYLTYVKEVMRWPLLASSGLLFVLGVLTVLDSLRHDDADADDAGLELAHHGEAAGHDHGPTRVAWLLALPLVIVVWVAPLPLGAYAVADSATRVPGGAAGAFLPLDEAVDGVVELTLSDFVRRSYFDTAATLAVGDLRLVGFVVSDPDIADGFRLTRFTLACCAADAFPIQVTVIEAGVELADDTWVAVTGRWVDPGDDLAGVERGATIEADAVELIEVPTNPYE